MFSYFKKKKSTELELELESYEGINKKDKDGNTALHHAVSNNQLEEVKKLLNSGARVDVKNNQSITPLYLIEERAIFAWEKLAYDNPDLGPALRRQKAIYDLLKEASQKQTQQDKVQKIIRYAQITDEDTIATKLGKIFNKYSDPNLFLLRHHLENQKICQNIGIKLLENPNWNWDECKKIIEEHISLIKNKLEPFGTLQGILIEMEKINIKGGLRKKR